MSEADPEITARLAEIGVPNPVAGPVQWRKLSEMPEIQEAARTPDIRYFPGSGTWVKPEGAVRVDIVLKGGEGVVSVTPVIADYGQAIARERRDAEWRDTLLDLAWNGPRSASNQMDSQGRRGSDEP